MKKILNLLVCMGLVVACSTNQPQGENDLDNPGAAIAYGYDIISPDRINVNPSCVFDHKESIPHIRLSLEGYRDADNMKFYTDETTLTLKEKMNEQYVAASGQSLENFNNDVIYASLTELSIVANTELWGIPSGEELSSCFKCSVYPAYHNKFPSGDLDKSTIGIEEFDIEEYINLEYMCNKYIALVAKPHLDNSELKEGIEFIVKVTFCNGNSFSGTSMY